LRMFVFAAGDALAADDPVILASAVILTGWFSEYADEVPGVVAVIFHHAVGDPARSIRAFSGKFPRTSCWPG